MAATVQTVTRHAAWRQASRVRRGMRRTCPTERPSLCSPCRPEDEPSDATDEKDPSAEIPAGPPASSLERGDWKREISPIESDIRDAIACCRRTTR